MMYKKCNVCNKPNCCIHSHWDNDTLRFSKKIHRCFDILLKTKKVLTVQFLGR